jgi:hypothetical protein
MVRSAEAIAQVDTIPALRMIGDSATRAKGVGWRMVFGWDPSVALEISLQRSR